MSVSDYTELLYWLRNDSCTDGSDCEHCPDSTGCYLFIMNKAADAIEELQKKYDGAVSDNKSLGRQIAELAKERNEAYSKGLLEGGIAQRAEDEKRMPKWISVYDKLPDRGDIVVVRGDTGTWDYGAYQGVEYRVSGEYRRDRWWWKKKTTKTVKWWMPKDGALPEPPKEK